MTYRTQAHFIDTRRRTILLFLFLFMKSVRSPNIYQKIYGNISPIASFTPSSGSKPLLSSRERSLASVLPCLPCSSSTCSVYSFLVLFSIALDVAPCTVSMTSVPSILVPARCIALDLTIRTMFLLRSG